MKNKFSLIISALIFGGLILPIAPSTLNQVKADEIVDSTGDFSYMFDYTKYGSYSDGWKNDTFDSNFMTISPLVNALGVGEQNVACDGKGFVTYKFDAPQGKAFSTMTAYWNGRVFHNIDGGDCAKGTCSCGMDILVSSDNTNYVNVGHENPSLLGREQIGFKHVLTDHIRTNKTVYVKIAMDGRNWDWINMRYLKVYGTYCDATKNISKVDVKNLTNDRIHAGEKVTISVDVNNNSDSVFNGTAKIEAPDFYFSEADKEPVSFSINPNSQGKVTIPATLLLGGYSKYFVCLYDGTNLVDRCPVTTFARGEGIYLFDTHSHSFESDGRNSLLDNYTQDHEKGLSGAISTDHDHPRPGDNTSNKAAQDILNEQIDEEFLAMKGTEVGTAGNFHILSYNFSTKYEVGTASQTVIDGVINEGGLSYLAHPFLPGYSNKDLERDPTRVDALNNMTGLELFNAESSMVYEIEKATRNPNDFDEKNLEYWDRLNITGKKKFFGTSGSDGHDSIIDGAVVTAFKAHDLTDEDIIHAYTNGNQFISTGAYLDFSIDGKSFGESVRLQESKTAPIHIEAYDPEYPIKKVLLYKFNVDPNNNDLAFQNGRNNVQTLYEQNGTKDYYFKYDSNITLNEGEFYRVEVFTEEGSLNWSNPTADGFAYGNPIFVEKEIKSMRIKSMPQTLTVQQYCAFNFAGLELEATFYDDSTKLIKGFEITGRDSSKLGKTKTKVSYENFTFDIEFDVVEQQGVVHAVDGNIDFYRDYSKYQAYDTAWQTDPAIDSINGNICIGANAKGLGVGKKNVSSSGSGYVTYRIEVPDGNVVDKLTMDVTGRIYHSSSNAECDAGTCGCCYQVYVSLDGGCNFTKAVDYDLDHVHSAWGQKFNFNLDEFVGTSKCILVRIKMSCKSWDWICMEDLRFTGTYKAGESIPVAEKGSILIGDGNIRYEKDFTSLNQYDSSWAEDKAVYKTEGMLTISPSTRCLGVGKQNTTSSASGSVSYKVDLPEGNIFDTLTFSASGRIYHSSSNAECAAGTCNCAFKIYVSVDGGYIFKEVYNHQMNHNDSKFNKTVTVDLSEELANRDTAIIKMYLSGKSWDWVGITNLEIVGTYIEGKAIHDAVITTEINQNFYDMPVRSEQWKEETYSNKNLCIGEGEKPWLSVDPGTVGFGKNTGELVYKLTSPTDSFADLSIKGTARVFTYQGAEAYFAIYYSFDGEQYNLLKSYTPTTNGGEFANIDLSLTDYINGQKNVYIKIEMRSGFWDWVCLKDIHILGFSVSNYVSATFKDAEGNIIYQTNEFTKNAPIDYSLFAKPGYNVEGLYLDQAFTQKFEGNSLVYDDNELYVKYELADYTLKYENTSIQSTTFNMNSEFELQIPEVEEGYIFEGYYLNSDFTGNKITKIDKGTTSDITVYAKIVINPNLVKAREDACDELDEYLENISAYRKAEADQITSIVTTAKESINNSFNTANIESLLANAINQLSTLKTDADYQLIERKENAINLINGSIDLTKYEEADAQQISSLIEQAISSIRNANNIDSIELIYNEFIASLAQFETIEVKELRSARSSAISTITNLCTDVLSKNITEEDKTLVASLKEDAIRDVYSAGTIDQINNILSSLENQFSNIKEIESNKGCSNSIVGSTAIVFTISLVGLMLLKRKEN